MAVMSDPLPPARHALIFLHSRLVGLMKLLLPAVALGVIAVIVVWPQLGTDRGQLRLGETRGIAAGDAERLRMVKARYIGLDDDMRPYVITADEAVQASGDANAVDLDNPKADMTVEGGDWVILTARTGVYYRDNGIVDLKGDVTFNHDNGSMVRTKTARLDVRAGSASGDDPTEAQGPSGEVHGEGFRVRDRGQIYVFTGRASAVLRDGDVSRAE
jgi:lipopolysaccharide export system protein LptC